MYLCPNAPGFPRGLLFGFRAPDDFDARYKAYGRHGCLRGKQCKQRGEYVVRNRSCHAFSISQTGWSCGPAPGAATGVGSLDLKGSI
jgi:hypothetical protein